MLVWVILSIFCVGGRLGTPVKNNQEPNYVDKKQLVVNRSMEVLLNEFQDVEQHIVEVSMEMSKIVSALTRTVFTTVDVEKRRLKKLREEVIARSHYSSTRSVPASRCVQKLGLTEEFAKQDLLWQKTYRCLHELGNGGALLETELTRDLVGRRTRVFQARAALRKCLEGLTEPDAACLGRVAREGRAVARSALPAGRAVLDKTHVFAGAHNEALRLCLTPSRTAFARMTTTFQRLRECGQLSQ